MIAIEHLHVIQVIHQEGSFRKASERLFKARSAVSYSVKQVEEHYGIQIFNRDTYRPELTRDGQLLIHKIQHLLNQANEFDTFARQINSETEAELRIGVSAIFPMAKLTALMQQLNRSYPRTRIHLNIEVASGERMLKDDLVDIGIYGALEFDSDVIYQQVEHCSLPVFISDNFPLAGQPHISQQDLLQYPQVVVKSSYKTSPDTGIMKDGMQWYVSDHATKRTLIQAGLCWGRLPLHEAQAEIEQKKLTVLEQQETMEVPVFMARKKSYVPGPVAMMVWDFFANQ